MTTPTTIRSGPSPVASRLLGLGTYRPRRTVTNAEICTAIRSSDEWIHSRSGIRQRRFAAADETLAMMAAMAGRRALQHAQTRPTDLDLVIVASMSNLVQTPPVAAAVTVALGAAHAAALDVSAACAGFCHALAIAADTIRAGNARHVLVVGSERMTDIVDATDRDVAFMFADGAGAVVVGRSPTEGIGPVVRGADHSSLDALRMNTSWDQFRADPSLPPPAMKMDGRRVYRWAMTTVPAAGQLALDKAGVTPDQLTAFIPHQANLRMIEALAERLKLPAHVAIGRDVQDSGNTSAASIPLAMERLLTTRQAPAGGAALLIGFGAGLNYAGQVVLLPPVPPATAERAATGTPAQAGTSRRLPPTAAGRKDR